MKRFVTANLWLAMLLLVACTGPRYINVPAHGRDTASNNANAEVVWTIEVEAIRQSLEVEPINGPYEVLLPAGTELETYKEVLAALGTDALPPGEPGEEAVPTVRVQAVRVRVSDAQVDLLRPGLSGRRMMTVYLTYELGHGWGAVDTRSWRVNTDGMMQRRN